jgi:hypothetical protein
LRRHLHRYTPTPTPQLHVANGLVKLRVSYWPIAVDSSTPPRPHPRIGFIDKPYSFYASNILSMRPCLCCDNARAIHVSERCRRSTTTSCSQKQTRFGIKRALVFAVVAASVPSTMAQRNCVSLQGSTACPAFTSASVDTNLTGNLYVQRDLIYRVGTNTGRK